MFLQQPDSVFLLFLTSFSLNYKTMQVRLYSSVQSGCRSGAAQLLLADCWTNTMSTGSLTAHTVMFLLSSVSLCWVERFCTFQWEYFSFSHLLKHLNLLWLHVFKPVNPVTRIRLKQRTTGLNVQHITKHLKFSKSKCFPPTTQAVVKHQSSHRRQTH